MYIGAEIRENGNRITIDNLKYCLLSKGINFNTHSRYYEECFNVYKGKIEDISQELFNDSIMFALYYKNIGFTNKQINNIDYRNYIMPYTAEELGCNQNDLNVLYGNNLTDRIEFDFRKWFHQFNFSQEAMDLYNSALEIFRYYHSTFNYENCGFQKSVGADFNDSFYDITSAIMGSDRQNQRRPENDTRVMARTRTTAGNIGFGRNTIKKVVPKEILPIFINFFDTRDILARKINKQLVESGLLLWERENIY